MQMKILIMPAVEAQLHQINNLLAHFSAQTALIINYNKSVLVPVIVPAEKLNRILGLLEFKLRNFPSTYLGLPLSANKIRNGDFTSI